MQQAPSFPMHREPRNHSIQALRGIAAMMVVVFHCYGQINWGEAFNPFVFAQAAWIGVDIFFAISGYVIGMSAINHSGSAEYNSTYWRARAARILPLYYVTTISYVLLLRPEAVLDNPALHIGTHVLLIHGFFSETMYSINGVTWSLAIELQFYALAYVFTPRLLRMKTSTVMFAFLATVLTAIAYRAIFFQVMTISGASTTAIAHQLSQAPSLMEGFAFGLLLAVLRRNSVALPKFPVSTFLFILITAYLVHHYVFNAVRENYWANPMIAILYRTFVAAIASLCIYGALALSFGENAVLACLQWLGKISYGIYLWHLIVLYTLSKTGLASKPLLLALATLVGALALATVSYQAIELPFIEWDRTRRAKR